MGKARVDFSLGRFGGPRSFRVWEGGSGDAPDGLVTAAFAATWFVSTEGLSFLAGWDTEGLGELPYGIVDGVVSLRVGGEDSFVVVFTRDGAWWGEVASRLYPESPTGAIGSQSTDDHSDGAFECALEIGWRVIDAGAYQLRIKASPSEEPDPCVGGWYRLCGGEGARGNKGCYSRRRCHAGVDRQLDKGFPIFSVYDVAFA